MTRDEWRALLRRWHIADESGDWQLANALLAEIERSPEPEQDLLVACAELLGMIDAAVDAGMNGSISNRCITTDKARVAIAKAEGAE